MNDKISNWDSGRIICQRLRLARVVLESQTLLVMQSQLWHVMLVTKDAFFRKIKSSYKATQIYWWGGWELTQGSPAKELQKMLTPGSRLVGSSWLILCRHWSLGKRLVYTQAQALSLKHKEYGTRIRVWLPLGCLRNPEPLSLAFLCSPACFFLATVRDWQIVFRHFLNIPRKLGTDCAAYSLSLELIQTSLKYYPGWWLNLWAEWVQPGSSNGFCKTKT